VSVILANKLSLQEFNQLIEVKLLYSGFPKILANFQGRGQMPILPPPIWTPMPSHPGHSIILLRSEMVCECVNGLCPAGDSMTSMLKMRWFQSKRTFPYS